MLVTAVRGEGHTALLSSHVITDIEQACDRLVVLGRGRTLLDLSVDDALAHHRVVEAAAWEPGRPGTVGTFPTTTDERLTLVRVGPNGEGPGADGAAAPAAHRPGGDARRGRHRPPRGGPATGPARGRRANPRSRVVIGRIARIVRLTFRMHRFEVGAVVVLGALLFVGAIVASWALANVGLGPDCQPIASRRASLPESCIATVRGVQQDRRPGQPGFHAHGALPDHRRAPDRRARHRPRDRARHDVARLVVVPVAPPLVPPSGRADDRPGAGDELHRRRRGGSPDPGADRPRPTSPRRSSASGSGAS